jgi:hypothetical protein
MTVSKIARVKMIAFVQLACQCCYVKHTCGYVVVVDTQVLYCMIPRGVLLKNMAM